MDRTKDVKCILCGDYGAKRTQYTDPPEPEGRPGEGYKYKCSECGPFAVQSYAGYWITCIASEEQKIKLVEYLKRDATPEKYFKELRWRDIRWILDLS